MAINLFRETQKTTTAKFIDYLSGFIGLIIFANVIGAEGLGLYYIYLAIATIAVKPVSGIGVATEQKISSKSDKSGISASGLLLSILYLILISILFVTIIYALNITLFSASNQTIIIIGLLMIGLGLSTIIRRIYSGFGHPGNSTFVSSGEGIIETIIQVLLVIFVFSGAESLLIGTLISSVIGFLFVISREPVNISRPNYDFISEILEFSKWSIITKLSKQIYKDIDTLLIGYILSPSVMGVYEAAMRIIKPSKIVSYGIKKPILVKVGSDIETFEDAIRTLNLYGSYAGILSIPIFFGGILLGQDLIINIFGSEFINGYIVIILGSIYYLLYCNSSILSEFLHGLSEPRSVSISSLFGTLFRIIFGIIGLLYVGITGLLFSIIFAEFIRNIILIYSIYKTTEYIYKPRRIIYQLISGVIMFIFVAFIYYNISISFISLIILIILGGLIYFTSLLITDSLLTSSHG